MGKRSQWTAEQGRQHRTARRRVLIAALCIIGGALIVIGILFWRANFTSENTLERVGTEQEEVTAIDQTKPISVEGRYLFSGTTIPARAIERDARGDWSQPFSKMDTFNPEQYDAMAVDWECPSTEDEIPYETQINFLQFNCHVKWLPEVSKHFSMVSLANNHTFDLGQEAFLETQKNLNAAGIQTYGNHDPGFAEDTCEIMALPVRLQMPDGGEQEGVLPVAFCAWHYFFRTPLPGELEVMEDYAKIMPVFGFMHAGAEYFPKASEQQEAIGRKIIDLGAEFVVGNSPHWVQNSEVYKGKPIFYSTGNFIFDQIDNETMRGMSVDVAMSVEYDDNIAKWLAIGEQCRSLDDNCLELAQAAKFQKYDVSLAYDIVGNSNGARRVVTRADPQLQAAIEERVNWAETKLQLEQASN